jgi:hypothetical protein
MRHARCVAEALFSTRAPPPPARLDFLCNDLADFLHHAGSYARFVVVGSLLLTVWLLPLWVRRWPLAWVRWETRTETLQRIERSALGFAFLPAKAILCLIYFEHPDAGALLGFDSKCLVE